MIFYHQNSHYGLSTRTSESDGREFLAVSGNENPKSLAPEENPKSRANCKSFKSQKQSTEAFEIFECLDCGFTWASTRARRCFRQCLAYGCGLSLCISARNANFGWPGEWRVLGLRRPLKC